MECTDTTGTPAATARSLNMRWKLRGSSGSPYRVEHEKGVYVVEESKPPTGRDWAEHIGALTRQVERGTFYDRDLPALALALNELAAMSHLSPWSLGLETLGDLDRTLEVPREWAASSHRAHQSHASSTRVRVRAVW